MPRVETTAVTGRLLEANLEARSAQVRTPSGDRVAVRFGAEHEADIRRLLGDRAALLGDLTNDPRSRRAQAVRVTQIISGEQMGLDLEGVDTWGDRPGGG